LSSRLSVSRRRDVVLPYRDERAGNHGGDRGLPHAVQAPRRCEDRRATTPPWADEAAWPCTPFPAMRITATIYSTYVVAV